MKTYMPDLIKDHYYEVERQGKVEVVQFKRIKHSTAYFNFMDGDQEPFILTYDLIEDGIFKIKPYTTLNVLMA